MPTAPPIRIEVVTAFLKEQSAPEDGRYAFSYTITLHNDGQQPAKLLSRHWIISSSG